MERMSEYANTWPRGGLFAFSGIDGETCHAEPFVASSLDKGVGWAFWLTPRVTVTATVGTMALKVGRPPDDICFSDCWRCTVRGGEYAGSIRGAFLDRTSMAVQMDFDYVPEGLFPNLATVQQSTAEDGTTIVTGEGWWLVLTRDPEDTRRRFGVAISYTSEAEAIRRAEQARISNLDAVIAARLSFYESVKPPERLAGANRRVYYKAVSVLKVNCESAQLDIPCRWNTPDRMPHRHMWLWDTAFTALGLQYLRQDLGEDALRALFAKQRPDGRLALAARPEAPGADDTEDRKISCGESQPPIVTWSAWRQFEYTRNQDFLAEAYPRLVKYLSWFETNRRKVNGLYGWMVRTESDPVRGARGGESGMDNSPRFDDVTSMTAVDLSAYMANEYRCLGSMAEVLGNGEADRWRGEHSRISELINDMLWDDEDRFYYDLDENNQFVPVKTTAGFMPMLPQIPCRDRAESLRMHLTHPQEFWTEFPVPSVSRDEATFSKDMWRGPAWVNVNVLLYHALLSYGFFEEARELVRKTMAEIVRVYSITGCLYEYYDSLASTLPADLPRKGGAGKHGGVGFGVVADLDWTAAAYVHLAHETA
jgi:hypothetical protein